MIENDNNTKSKETKQEIDDENEAKEDNTALPSSLYKYKNAISKNEYELGLIHKSNDIKIKINENIPSTGEIYNYLDNIDYNDIRQNSKTFSSIKDNSEIYNILNRLIINNSYLISESDEGNIKLTLNIRKKHLVSTNETDDTPHQLLNAQPNPYDIDNFEYFDKDVKHLNEVKIISTKLTKEFDRCRLFHAFLSLDNITILIIGTNKYDIDFYSLDTETMIHTIYRAHKSLISSVKRYPDLKFGIDFIISSSEDKSINVYNMTDHYQLILKIKSEFFTSCLSSGDILIDYNVIPKIGEDGKEMVDDTDDDFYVLSGDVLDCTRVFDSLGNFIRPIGENRSYCYDIKIYYEVGIYYIVIGGRYGVFSYYFKNGKEYNSYNYEKDHLTHCIEICNLHNRVCLVASEFMGKSISIYDFHSAEIIRSYSQDYPPYCFTVWNEEFIFVGTKYRYASLRIFQEGNDKIYKEYRVHKNFIVSTTKIVHPIYGECLIAGDMNGVIIVWA